MAKHAVRNLVLILILAGMGCGAVNAEGKKVSTDKMEWFTEAKFGMFIHWGLYSQAAGYWKGKPVESGAHFMIHEKISLKEYGVLADAFNPVKFNAEEWVLLAKRAGMKYLVITSKHHEGFAMYDSPSSDYNIVKRTPYGKDPMKALAAACQKHGIKLCFYYSLGRDWEDPDVPTNWPTKGGRSNLVDYPDEDAKVFSRYFERKVKPQVKELLTQYGPVAVLWFDTPERISRKESRELKELINTLQPDCIVNNRIGNGFGDFEVKEQKISEMINRKPWESCITMSKSWSYMKQDTFYKSPELLVRQLVDIVSKGGNFLLNVGPTAEGIIPEESVVRLKAIGDWMDINEEGVRGTTPWRTARELLGVQEGDTADADKSGAKKDDKDTIVDAVNDATSKKITPEVRFTSKGNDLYAFVCSHHEKDVLIRSLALSQSEKIKTITVLGTTTKIEWKQTEEGLKMSMPDYPISEIPVLGLKITY